MPENSLADPRNRGLTFLMAKPRSPRPAKDCLVLIVACAVATAGCAASRSPRPVAPAPPSPEALAMSEAAEAFSRGRDAALAGDFQCAQAYFSQAVDVVQAPGTSPPANPEVLAFSLDLYEGIQRYEALSAPPEDAAASEDHIAPELK